MAIGHEGVAPGLPEEAPMRTIRHDPVELNDLIMIEEDMLASDPNSFAYQLGLRSVNARWKKLFGTERIPLSYPDTVRMYAYVGTSSDDVAQLLGPTSPAILRKISGLINVAAVEDKWPLEALEVHLQTDPEIEDLDGKDVLLVLKLRTSFDKADEMLKSLYPKLETFKNSLSDDERLIFTNGIFFDVESVVPPEPNENLIK